VAVGFVLLGAPRLATLLSEPVTVQPALPAPAPRLERQRPVDTAGAAKAEPDPDEQTDLYGNAVTEAVAKYKLDRAGSTLYELHSPQTELPRLGSPVS
jgi:hypothetical protein